MSKDLRCPLCGEHGVSVAFNYETEALCRKHLDEFFKSGYGEMARLCGALERAVTGWQMYMYARHHRGDCEHCSPALYGEEVARLRRERDAAIEETFRLRAEVQKKKPIRALKEKP